MTHGTAAARPYEAPERPRLGGGPPTALPPPAVSNARIAIVMLMVAETMLFTTLIGGYVVLRGAGGAWPPPGQPRLPLAVTWVNTFVLLASCWTMWRARRALKAGEASKLRFSLAETALLGSTFLAIQGTEWVQLVSFGMTMSASVYGATFYLLVGLHGIHVLAAVVWLLVVVARFRGDRFTLKRAAPADLCAIYWFYVCGLWAVLFPLVYLY
jgi:heme/copper-type cytochrome/quinol oxidase subunit 3